MCKSCTDVDAGLTGSGRRGNASSSQVAEPGVFVHGRRLGEARVVVGGPAVERRRQVDGRWGHRQWGWSRRAPLPVKRGLSEGRRQRGGSEALEDVVLARVAVPVLVSGTLELDAELKSLSDHARDVRVVDGEDELVGEPVAGSVHVDPVDVRRRLPVVGRVTDDHLLVEVEVDHSGGAPDGLQVAHVGALQTDLSVAQGVEEAGAAARLVEERRNGRRRRRWKRRQRRRPRRRLDLELKLGPGVALDVAKFCVLQVPESRFRNSGNFVQKGFHVGQVEAEDIGKSEIKITQNCKTISSFDASMS